MKSLRAILAALFTTAASTADQPKQPSKPPAEIMRELRLQWLTRKPAPEEKKEDISAVVMDWPLEQQTITILASSVGDASVYTTATFGIMGGIGHEKVRKAAISLVECAKKHLGLALPTSDYSYPDHSHVRFFFVTPSGVRSVTFPATEVQKEGTDAYDLYARGQEVLTELRLTTRKERGY